MKYFFILLLFLKPFFLKAQSTDLKQYDSFFQSKVEDINVWLKSNGIPDSLLKVDTVLVLSHQLKLLMAAKDNTNWQAVNSQSIKSIGKPFSEILFKKVVFMMDVENPEIVIEVDSKDAMIFLYDQNGHISEEVMEKMGEISDNYKIPFTTIPKFMVGSADTSSLSTNMLKNALISGLEKYFEKYETFFENYEFNVINRLDNELFITVNNVSNVILDEGYFEYIRIDFEFGKSKEDIIVSYEIRGKYGSGIIWAPKRSDYYDMDPKYLDDLQLFSLKIKNKIDVLLKSE